MAVSDMGKIWYAKLGKPNRKLTFQHSEALERLQITEAQFRWSMNFYLTETAYPHLGSFIEFVEELLKRGEIPESLICMAFLSDNSTLIQIAEDLNTLSGAWYPDEQTKQTLDELRASLQEAFN